MKYELRICDIPLLSFDINENKWVQNVVQNITILNAKSGLFPLNLEITDYGLYSWLRKRIIPKNRINRDKIITSLNIVPNDDLGIIITGKGLSLNDSYWIVPCGFNGTFSQYNLYENQFSEILSRVALTGTEEKDLMFSISPELTTNGMLPKAWRRIENDSIYLYKGGSRGKINGNEPYSEYYASQIAKAMELDAVFYDLDEWNGVLASKCKLFTDIDTSFIPIWRIVSKRDLSFIRNYYYERGEIFKNNFNDMFIFDALIYNEDRHFGNFGVLRNNKSGEIISPAPIFDNGASLFRSASEDDFKNIDDYATTLRPHNCYRGAVYNRMTEHLITRRQVKKLQNMIDFTFRRHKKHNLPEWRLTIIEEHLQRRVIHLLNIGKGTQ
jgi:hypothetical protein